MSNIAINILKGVRLLYLKVYQRKKITTPECDDSPESAAKAIYDVLANDKPAMIARIGAVELACITNYIGVKGNNHNIIEYISGKTPPWWWEKRIINNMQECAGFFCATEDKAEEFCNRMFEDMPLIDILGSWLNEELLFEGLLKNSKKVHLELLNPYFSHQPWTKALEGKKVLVVHPFARTIEKQYQKRTLLFEKNLLPEFELLTIKAVQTIAGIETPFIDWFAALNHMIKQVEDVDFDICLIGCGAYGLPLAAHVKRMGKKGVHLGGSLQLLFGIRGKRWEDENYNDTYNYAQLMNEHWVRPNEQETPKNARLVENAAYW